MKYSGAGINIQFPISQLILSGDKTVETRTYPIPEQYIGVQLALIETPGPRGKFKARVVGLITFGKSRKFRSKKEFYQQINLHKVDKTSPWAWNDDKPKWAWPIEQIIVLNEPKAFKGKRGIVFSKAISF